MKIISVRSQKQKHEQRNIEKIQEMRKEDVLLYDEWLNSRKIKILMSHNNFFIISLI